MLLSAVIIAGDGSGADIDAGADLGIAQVREVVGLRAGAELCILQFDKVPDVRSGANLVPARKRANGPIRAPDSTCESAIEVNGAI